MKKLISLALVLCMVLSFSVAAFATVTANTEPSFSKIYKITNEGTTSPEETFTFKFTALKVEENNTLTQSDMPSIGNVTTTFSTGTATTGGLSQDVTVKLNSVTWPGVGVYYYKVEEVAGKTAGVLYSSATPTLKVTVANSGTSGTYYVAFVTLSLDDGNKDGNTDSKTASFTNEYQAVKNLEIQKTVSGAMGNTEDEYFAIKVTLTNPTNKTAPTAYTVGDLSYSVYDEKTGATTTNPTSITAGVETTFYIKHGETINIKNVPYGVTYTVSETVPDGYDVSYKVNNASKSAVSNESVDSGTEHVDVINTATGTVDMGVALDTIPYIALMLVATAGLAVVLTRKRRNED